MRKQKFGIILPIILISYFMIVLDDSIIFTSTDKIAADLSISTQTLAWVTNAYALTFGGLLLFFGKIGDVIGRKFMFLTGLMTFSVSSLLVGISFNEGMIIAMRAIQGIGAAILAPTTLSLLMDNYSDGMRIKAIALYGATGGFASSVGLIVGGIITTFFNWRIGFFINSPIGIILFLLAIKYIRNNDTNHERVDILGTILSIVGLSAFVYSIDGSNHRVLLFVVAIIALTLFVLQEGHSTVAITPLKLFHDGERSFAYLSRFFSWQQVLLISS